MRLIDSHAHLDFEALHEDFDQVLRRAKQGGVEKIITIGVSLATSESAIALAESHDHIFATVGVHPEESTSLNLEKLHGNLLDLAKSSKRVVAMGETGLDYYQASGTDLVGKERDEHSLTKEVKDLQIAIFKTHIEVAKHLGLPLIVHIRNGEDEEAVNAAYEILKNSGHTEGVIHCFTLGSDWARRFVDLGFHIGFTGIITYKNAEEIRSAVASVPLDKLFIETDCPFLAPQKYRGQRNEPAYVVEVATKVAEIKILPLAKVAEQTTINVEKLFNI